MSQDPLRPPLQLHHQQVLAFVSSYLQAYDCLPTSREAAVGCGFRSSHTVGRLVNELEVLGALHRNPDYPRLGWVPEALAVPAVPEAEQLWWCERDCIEHEAALGALQVGLSFALDLDAAAALHAEGTNRVTVRRALYDTLQRLTSQGSPSPPRAGRPSRNNGRWPRRPGAADRLRAYCLVRLVWNLSAREGLVRVQPLALGYLGSNLVAALRAVDALLPGYWAAAQPALARHELDGDLGGQLESLLRRLRAGLGRYVPHGSGSEPAPIRDLVAGGARLGVMCRSDTGMWSIPRCSTTNGAYSSGPPTSIAAPSVATLILVCLLEIRDPGGWQIGARGCCPRVFDRMNLSCQPHDSAPSAFGGYFTAAKQCAT